MDIKTIDSAWKYVEKNLFNEKTNLIYDHKHTSNDEFPTPQEIEKLFPNPCGYGTGMEDGMINGTTMLDACLCRYEKYKDENAAEFARKLFDGMVKLALCAKSEGFIPRAVTPVDGKSCYADSSRDQYTMFLFAMHRFLNSPFCTEADKEKIKSICVGVAKRAEKNVTAQNDYDMLCDDGKKTLVNTMWGDGLGNHEYLRLPMIYIMAWRTSGDKHWLDNYRKIRDEAYEKSLPMGEYWHLYTLQQMQASVLVCMQNDEDEGWREKYLLLMNTVADYVNAMIPSVRAEIIKSDNYNMPQKGFRSCTMKDSEWPDRKESFKSVVRADTTEFFTLQDAANIIIVTSLVPGRAADEKAIELFEEAFLKIDFTKHERCVPVHFLEAYFRIA